MLKKNKTKQPEEQDAKTGKYVYIAKRNWSKPALLIAGIVLVVALIAGGVYFATRNGSDKPKEAVTEEGVVLRQLSNEELVDQVNKLIFEEKYSSAEQLIEFQEAADSYELRLLLAATYNNQDKNDDALRVLMTLEDDYPNDWQIAKSIGQTYERKDDSANAILYYQKSLDLLGETEDVPVRDDEIFFLEQDISRLEGQG